MTKALIEAELKELEEIYRPARSEFHDKWLYVDREVERLDDMMTDWRVNGYQTSMNEDEITPEQAQTALDALWDTMVKARAQFDSKWFDIKFKIDKCSEALRLIEEENMHPVVAIFIA